MKPFNLKIALITVLGSALLSACGGGGSDDMQSSAEPPPATVVAPDVTVAVPAEVSTSPVAATNYVASLSSQPEASTDTLDPVVVPEQLAQDDTAEPA
jgi:hypothetical protein